MTIRWLPLVMISVTSFLSVPIFASSEFVPIQERAEGQSLGGATLLNDSLFSNPAASAFTTSYSVEGTYDLPRSFAFSVLDSTTTDFTGGLAYFRQFQDGNPNVTDPVQGLKLGFGGKVAQNMATGIAGKIMWGPGLDGSYTKLNDIDLGYLANFQPAQVGLTLRNVFNGNPNMAQQREYALGGRIGYDNILFANATLLTAWGQWKPYQYGFGAEYVTPYYISLKGGFRIQPDNNLSGWSVGASILAPKIALHYALEFPTQDGGTSNHTLAATIMF
jgi:hypothetical protein